MSFQKLIDRKKYEDIVEILSCVETTAKIRRKSIEHVLGVLEIKYFGIKTAYESFKRDKGEILVPTNKGTHVYTKKCELPAVVSTTTEREDAELSVNNMRVNVTGARNGESLVGVHNTSKDAVIKIVKGRVPPMKRSLDSIHLFKDLWLLLLQKLSQIDFFREFTDTKISIWLNENEREGDFDIAEVEDLKIEVLDVGKSKFTVLEPEVIDSLLSEGERYAIDVRNMFPFKPGSRGLKGRSVLLFYLYFWKISVAYKRSNSSRGLVYNLKTGDTKKGTIAENDEEIFIFKDSSKKEFGILVDKSRERVDYFDLLTQKYSQNSVTIVVNSCKNFTAAGFKSLLQKIIRYSPLSVDLGNGNIIDSNIVLEVVFTLLLTNRGSFVPDIQRYVSGQESAFKRLSVAILEDSSIQSDKSVLKLGIMAFLSQRLGLQWRPSKKQYTEVLDLLRETLNTTYTYVQDIKRGFNLEPFTLSEKNTDIANYSAILDILRSFASDLAMTRFIAFNNGEKVRGSTFFERPEIMRLSYCIDQHWAPELIYFLPFNIVEKYRQKGSKPFKRLLKKIFIDVTGYNTRRRRSGLTLHKESNDKDFIVHVKRAQELTLLAKQVEPIYLPTIPNEKFELSKTIDLSWIAGLVGSVDVHGRPPVIVTLIPDDPKQMVAVRRPARGVKDSKLTDEQIDIAIMKVKRCLHKEGLRLNKTEPPVKYLEDCVLILDKNEDYIFVKDKERYSWEEISNIHMNIAVHSQISEVISFEDVLRYTGRSVQLKGRETLERYLERYSKKVIQRFISYISSNRRTIEISRLAKDGGGTSSSVTIEDVGCCQLFLYLCTIFPRAIERYSRQVSKFKIKLLPLFWEIRSYIFDYFRRKYSCEHIGSEGWNVFEDTSDRIMRSYQRDTLQEMIKMKRKGHFLWLSVGLGKTLIALSFLKYLNDNNKLPKYVIYTLPRSALESIIREIEWFEIPINLLLPIKSWSKHPKAKLSIDNTSILPFHINIVEHDHLRLLEDELIEKSPESFVIIDEVHKVLNDTKRTSIALDVSRLSIDFVALTGTPIIDSNTYKLIWWLEQIVDFEVNENNFWVAASAMISKRVNTGIETDREDVLAEMTNKERGEYYELVPPQLGGTNTHPISKDIKESFEMCYNICDREIIHLTLNFLREKKGTMLVARNTRHQERLRELLIDGGLKSKDIFLLQKNDSIYMTDESVKKGITPDYRVVITTLNKSEGYTLTRLQVMITGVYPSNQATREQLEGRINRLSQYARIVYYRTVHTGILTFVLKRHRDASSLSAVFSSLAKEIDIID